MSWADYLDDINHIDLHQYAGRITKVSNLSIEAIGVHGNIGDLCSINCASNDADIYAQVISQSKESVVLMPFGSTDGIGIDAEITCLNTPLKISMGDELLGQVIDPLGNFLSEGSLVSGGESAHVRGKLENPLNREDISDFILTGVKAIDAFLSVGKGQRIGIFAGSGVGKSTLLGMIAKGSTADVNVIALIGERGREVNEFIHKTLGSSLSNSVVITATADQPTLVRELAAHTATAVAEYFSNNGKDVMLIMDSVTRFAMARREIGLSVGEPATARGYTPSTFTELPKLIERAGNFKGRGSITGIYTVLVEGDDLNEPVSDHMRAILDGHIVLSRDLANQNHYPAIDILKSISRLATDLWTEEEKITVDAALKVLGLINKYKDIVDIGAYKEGSNPRLDEALNIYPSIEAFLTQKHDMSEPYSREGLFDFLREAIAIH